MRSESRPSTSAAPGEEASAPTVPVVDRIDPFKKCSRNRRAVSSHYPIGSDAELTALPDIESAPEEEREKIVVQKLVQCQKLFDFSDPLKNVRSKEVKRAALNELIDFFSDKRVVASDSVYPEMIALVTKNVFRQLPPPSSADFDPDEDEPTLELAWPHLCLVYELFLCFLESPGFNVALAKNLIGDDFVINMLRLFDCEDPRERDMLKTLLHRIYGRFFGLRALIRKEINNVFLAFIYENESFNGIEELLEILGSIINGFTLPLKDEHKLFLQRILLPLHKPKCLKFYHTRLTYCLYQFIEKDKNLIPDVFNALFRIWPRTSLEKEQLFLAEVDELLLSVDLTHFDVIAEPLCRQVCRSITTGSFQVAERALFLLRQQNFCGFVNMFAHRLYPIIIPALLYILDNHWNRNTRRIAIEVFQVFVREDAPLVKKIEQEYDAGEEDKIAEKSEEVWRCLEKMALRRAEETEDAETMEAEEAVAMEK